MNLVRRVALTIRSETGETVAELEWQEGRTTILSATPFMRTAAERWLSRGLTDYEGEGDSATPRTTPASSPDFLPSLERYLARQFTFRMSLCSTVEKAPSVISAAASHVVILHMEKDESAAAGAAIVFALTDGTAPLSLSQSGLEESGWPTADETNIIPQPRVHLN